MVNLQLLSFHNHLQNPSLLTNHSRISTLHPLLATCFGATIARFPSSKTTGKNVAFSCRYSSYVEMFSQRTTGEPSYALSTAAGVGGGDSMSPLKVFVGYSVYKGKAALTVEPRPPEFAYLDSGAFKVSKEGFILLQFAPAAGVRQYDWSRKQIFSLSVAEIGNLISLGPRDSCEFFHDPHKGKSEEGKVRKVLKVEPLPDGSGHFFNLSVQNKLLNVDDTIYIPITKAEHTILTSAFNFVVPYLLGWHTFANAIKPDDVSNVKENIPNEWSR